MTKEDAKLVYALLSHYEKLYTAKYGRKPVINRYREKWAMTDVIDSVGFDRSKELLDYYFKIEKPGHPLPFFYNTFDRMGVTYDELQEDAERRKRIREQTKRMVEEQTK